MLKMPVPTWICWVRAAMYGRKHSFAERCEYSVRKWCSVAHVYLNPDRSAAIVQLISFCSRCDSTAHWSAWSSYVRRGTYNELKIPNSISNGRSLLRRDTRLPGRSLPCRLRPRQALLRRQPTLDHGGELGRVVHVLLVVELAVARVVQLRPVDLTVDAAVPGVGHLVPDRAEHPAARLVDHVPVDRERDHVAVDRLGHRGGDPLEDRGPALVAAVVVLVVLRVVGEALGPRRPVAVRHRLLGRGLEPREGGLDLVTRVHVSP